VRSPKKGVQMNETENEKTALLEAIQLWLQKQKQQEKERDKQHGV